MYNPDQQLWDSAQIFLTPHQCVLREIVGRLRWAWSQRYWSGGVLSDNFILGNLQCFQKHKGPLMIGAQLAKEIQVLGEVPKLLQVASFGNQNSLWVKQSEHPLSEGIQLCKKYKYSKIGKTLGFQTVRYLILQENHLFYCEDQDSADFLGYCNLENIYLQWMELKSKRFLLLISNGHETSQFYFATPQFWLENRQQLTLMTIQLNFNDNFQILQELGEGSFAKVYRVRSNQNGCQYAAKIVYKSSNSSATIKMLASEKKILTFFRQSNYIYQLREFYETNEEYIILMEYLQGVDLMSLIRMKLDISLPQIKYLMTNILMGIKECHDNQIIHRDIKPQNIIVDVHTFQMKIIDFGLSLHTDLQLDRSHYKKCGTVGYMAPEVYNSHKTYDEKCDMFSFGVIAYMLLEGINPLKGKNYEQTCSKNKQCNIILNEQRLADSYGQNCVAFLKRLLTPSCQSRYSAEEALLSPFLRDNSCKSSSTTVDDDKARLIFD